MVLYIAHHQGTLPDPMLSVRQDPIFRGLIDTLIASPPVSRQRERICPRHQQAVDLGNSIRTNLKKPQSCATDMARSRPQSLEHFAQASIDAKLNRELGVLTKRMNVRSAIRGTSYSLSLYPSMSTLQLVTMQCQHCRMGDTLHLGKRKIFASGSFRTLS